MSPRPSVEAERREQILRATWDVLAEKGFRALRISDVAARARASTGTVHYYFDSKRELLRAAFELHFARSLDRRRELLAAPVDPLERLVRVVESYLPVDPETVAAWRVWAVLWVEALGEPDLQAVNESVYGEWRGVIAGIIREGQVQGAIRAGDPVQFANALIAMIDGLAIQVLLGSAEMTAEDMRGVCLGYLRDLEPDRAPAL